MAVPTTARAMVQHGPRDLRPGTFDIPAIGDDDALLRVEACGICGSDYEQYEGVLRVPMPVIPGHEPVGIIEEIGETASRRWGVVRGDRVAVEALLPCGVCRACGAGNQRMCRGTGGLSAYGYKPVSAAPSLWGGFAEYLYLAPRAIVHKMRADIPAEIAVMFNPLGAGFRWAVDVPRLRVRETIVILGPGQRGIGAVLAARAAGAGTVIVTGLSRDEHKLALAREFGADRTIDVEREDLVRRVREITDGEMADVVLDVTAYAVDAVTQAIDLAKRGGRVVLGGTKGPTPVPNLLSDKIVVKELAILGTLGVDWPAYEAAIRMIESGTHDLAKLHTHTLPLHEAERGLALLAGKVAGEQAVHVALVP